MPNKTTFRLSAVQTVRTIAETHVALAAFYGKSAAVAIDPTKVTDADLTLVQLIESVRIAAARDGKKLCMTAHPPEAVLDVLVRGGFLNSPDNALFWTAP